MSFLNDNKKSPVEINVTVDAEAASFLSGDIEFSKEDIEESRKMFYRETQLAQGLNSRLIGMIALVGIFGTGLFLSYVTNIIILCGFFSKIFAFYTNTRNTVLVEHLQQLVQ